MRRKHQRAFLISADRFENADTPLNDKVRYRKQRFLGVHKLAFYVAQFHEKTSGAGLSFLNEADLSFLNEAKIFLEFFSRTSAFDKA
jgi:hypothetical protein